MAAEFAWQKRHPAEGTLAGDYEFSDTMASLSMGVGSLAAPYVSRFLLAPVTPRRGRYAKALMGLSLAAAAVTTAGDLVRHARTGDLPEAGTVPSSPDAQPEPTAPIPPALQRITGSSAVAAMASDVVTVSTLWSAETAASKLFRRTPLDLGSGPLAYAVAILGWDVIYYWNHRGAGARVGGI